MLKPILIIYFLLFIMSFNLVKGQSYYYKNYTADNGLPSSEAFHVIQDKKGFVWIATNQGVSRFDGYEFTNFDTQSGLPRNTILEIFEDEIGRIWFISITGELSWFENDSIHIYPYNDVILKFNAGNLGRPLKGSFYSDSTNKIYIGFNMKSLIEISSNGELKVIKSNTKPNYQVIKILPNRNVVFSSNRGTIDGLEVQIKNKYNIVINKEYEYVNRFFAYSIDNSYLFVRENILYVIDKRGSIKEYLFEKDIIWISQDSNKNIWLGFLWGGVKKFSSLNFESVDFEFFKGKSVSSVLLDKEGGCYFSTIENGLYYIPDIHLENKNLINNSRIKTVQNVENINDKILIVADGNKLFEKGEKDAIFIEKAIVCKYKIGKVFLLKAISDYFLLSYMGRNKSEFIIFRNNKNIFSIDKVKRDVIFIDDNILAGYNFLHLTKKQKKEEKGIWTDKFVNIFCLLRASENSSYIATDNGLFEFNLESKEIQSIDYSPLLRIRMNYLVKDKKQDVVWIGTKGGGLLRLEGEKVSQVSMKEGLLGNSVNHVEQSDSILWLATNNGIVKLFLNEESNFIYTKDSSLVLMETFTRANGLLNNEVFDIALDNENVYAGTNNGLACFKQDLSGRNDIPPPIYVTGIKVMGKDTLIQDSYELNFDQNYLEFNFVGLSYQREEALRYLYILEGVNDDWVETQNRSVQFPMLPPGDYVFKVKAYNRSGVESEQVQKVSFKINKAYYQTLLFKMGVAFITLILLSLIFVYIFYVKMREVKKRDIVKDELNKFRQRALSAQMNPHFIYNSLNSVQSYILKNEREKSSTYLAKFGKLMRRILENSQNPVISLSEEIEALKVYVEMELVRFRDSFNFHLNIDKDVEIKEIDVPPLIIQPYVENAIHHGLRMKKGEKNVWIHISRQEDNICIAIEDDGIGRKESQRIRERSNNRLKSFGTEITDKRLSLFKELYKNEVGIKILDIEGIDKESKKGTRVEISIKSLD
jgi:ligand-binding sensor domain-containing protein